METFTPLKPFAENPKFARQREKALKALDFSAIDKPILEIVKRLAKLPHLFTLQSCYGHFLHDKQKDSRSTEALIRMDGISQVDYRIAYFAFCIENNEQGRNFLQKLKELSLINPEYIQIGCAGWFWKRFVNSYIIQIEPERFKDADRCFVDFEEAMIIQDVRDKFFKEFGKII
jgi:hypothetical protein